jgi:cytoskeletal protein CcmA (bactofilin family)
LILNPQDVNSEYWTGAVGQQLVDGSDDYYDITVARDDSDPANRCNYIIDCNSYRLKAGEKVGRSGLEAELRLDPCIAYWVGTNTTVSQRITINGDVYSNGMLVNIGTINGDVFANSLIGSITGQQEAIGDLSLQWPQVTVGDFTSHYTVQSIGPVHFGATYGPYNPVRVCYRGSGNVELNGNVQIYGMLVVEGDLTIRTLGEYGNVITAAKNLPALLVTGDLKVENSGVLFIDGLAVVEGEVQISAGTANLNINGGLFTQNGIVETTADSSSNDNVGTVFGCPTWQPLGGQTGGALEFDGVDDKVEVLNAGSCLNGLSAVTVSLWVKSDIVGADHGILFSREPTLLDEELGIRYDMAGAAGHGTKGIKASIKTTTNYTQIESTSNVQTTGWQHLGLVWESGSSLKLYIDGQLDSPLYDRGTVSGTITGVEKLMLGRGSKGQYWDGLMDSVRIYNRALDPNEIYPPVDGLTGLVGHWKLDEDAGSNVGITAAPSKTAIIVWPGGVEEYWGSAAGAFFRRIERK